MAAITEGDIMVEVDTMEEAEEDTVVVATVGIANRS